MALMRPNPSSWIRETQPLDVQHAASPPESRKATTVSASRATSSPPASSRDGRVTRRQPSTCATSPDLPPNPSSKHRCRDSAGAIPDPPRGEENSFQQTSVVPQSDFPHWARRRQWGRTTDARNLPNSTPDRSHSCPVARQSQIGRSKDRDTPACSRNAAGRKHI
jgi:hypothetical protein